MSRLLLLSNSTLPGTPFLSWPATFVREFLGDERGNLLFIPFAAVTFSYDEYAKSVREAVARWGYEIESVHNSGNCRQAVNDAAAVVIGGGNTFALLNQLYRQIQLLLLYRNRSNQNQLLHLLQSIHQEST